MLSKDFLQKILNYGAGIITIKYEIHGGIKQDTLLIKANKIWGLSKQ